MEIGAHIKHALLSILYPQQILQKWQIQFIFIEFSSCLEYQETMWSTWVFALSQTWKEFSSTQMIKISICFAFMKGYL